METPRIIMFAAERLELWDVLRSSAAPLLGLLAALIIAALIIVRVRDSYRDREDHTAMPHHLLVQYREMQREGDLTDEEYRSIKQRLVQQVESSARGAATTPTAVEKDEITKNG